MLNWLWAYMTYRRGTRLITSSTEAELSIQRLETPP